MKKYSIKFLWSIFFLSLAIFNSESAIAIPITDCDSKVQNNDYEHDFMLRSRLESQNVASGILIYKTLHGLGGEHDAIVTENSRYQIYHSFSEGQKVAAEWDDIVRSEGLAPQPSQGWRRKNCVYQTAINNYESVKKDAGSSSAYPRRWVNNQMQVFQACSVQDTKNLEFKPEIAQNDPPRAVFDREYQEASFYFYKDDDEKAQNLYEKIYKTADSPYRGQAGYMIARLKSDTPDAYNWLITLEKDPTLASYYPLFNEYRFITAYNGCDKDGDNEEDQDKCVKMNINHLKFLKDNVLNISNVPDAEKLYFDSIEQLDYYLQTAPGKADAWWFSENNKDSSRLKAYLGLASRDNFFDWMQTFYAFNPEANDWTWYQHLTVEGERIENAALDHALQKWKSTNSDEWLYLAALRMYPSHPSFSDVRDAAQKIFDAHKCSALLSDKIIAQMIWPHLIFMKMVDAMPDSLVQELVASYKNSDNGPLGFENRYDTKVIDESVRYLLHQKRYDDIKKLAEAFIQAGIYNHALYTAYISFLKTPEEAFGIISKIEKTHRGAVDDLLDASLHIIDRLSVQEMVDMLEKGIIPTNIQPYAARTAFVRAVLLKDKGLFEKSAYQVAKTHPFLKNDIAAMLDDSGKDPQAKQVTAFLLKHPRFNVYTTNMNVSVVDERRRYRTHDGGSATAVGFDQIDVYNHNDNNWWCSLEPEKAQKDAEEYLFWSIYRPYEYLPRQFEPLISFEQDEETAKPFFAYAHSNEWVAKSELQALASKPSGPEYLTKKSISYAGYLNSPFRHWLEYMDIHLPDDPLIPEMLHESIVTTRYGCNRDGSHATYSREAFRILYHSYPHSAWTKLTPFWFQ